MARYLYEMVLAPQAFAALVKNPGDRIEANRAVVESVGGELLEYYFAVGTNTVYTIMEIPDTLSAEALTMAVLAGGAVTSIRATAILTSAEAVDAMKMAGGTGYQPPSS